MSQMSQMSPEENPNRALEIVIAERVFSRLKTQMLIVYLVSFALAALVATSLMYQHYTVSRLSEARISEYRLLVSEKLQELHRLDLDEVANRTRPATGCPAGLDVADAEHLLATELGRPPAGQELDQLLQNAQQFGMCDIGEVQHILDNRESTARVDTVYRLLLGRGADPIGRFIYGYWLASGIEIEAVGRDIMVSPEFQRLKRLAADS